MQASGRMKSGVKWQNNLWKNGGEICRRSKGEDKRLKKIEGRGGEHRSKEKKKLQIDNYVNQTTCIELQEVVAKKMK